MLQSEAKNERELAMFKSEERIRFCGKRSKKEK